MLIYLRVSEAGMWYHDVMSINLAELVDLTALLTSQARDSDDVYAIMGDDDEVSSEAKETSYLSAVSRALRKRGVNVRSMTREVSFYNQFAEGHDFTAPIYYLHYQGEDFASYKMGSLKDIWENMHRLIDTDHHGVVCSGWGLAHDVSDLEDAHPQEALHDWFDHAVGELVANAQAQTIERRTRSRPAAKRPRHRI